MIDHIFFVSGEPFQVLNISNNKGDSNKPQIYAFNKTLHMIWTDKFEGNYEIYYSNVDNKFQKLSNPINLSNNNGSSAFPRLHVEENTIYATWYDYSPGQSDVFFAKSKDGGKSFSAQNLSNDQKASYNPWISAEKNNVYLVWNDGGKSEEIEVLGEKRIVDVLFGDMEIYFAHSDNYGETFEIQNISNTEGDSVNPRLRIDESTVFVTWSQDVEMGSDIYFSKSENHGLNFTMPKNISKSPERSYDSGIESLEDNIYTIWKEDHNNQTNIYFSKSDDYGDTFDTPINLSLGKNSSIIRDSQIKALENFVFVVFSAEVNQNNDVFITISQDKGKTFDEPINLSNNFGESRLPQIYLDEKGLFVIWEDKTAGNFDILRRQSTDHGLSFGPAKNITSDESDSLISILGPQITSTDDNTFVFWENKSKTDDLFLTIVPNETEYVFESNNQKIKAKIEVKEGNLHVPINLEFYDKVNNNSEDVMFNLIAYDSVGEKVIESTEVANKGYFYENLNFTTKGQYYISVESMDPVNSFEEQNIIVNVVPEFPSGLSILVVISTVAIIIGKKFTKFSLFKY
jgi:hypothetical protein